MTTPNQWTHSVADVYARRNGGIAQEFLALVVEPSLDALERRWDALETSGDEIRIAFESLVHAELINKTSMAFCLSIQALWERQLRSYLRLCPNVSETTGITPKEVDNAKWGNQISCVFLSIRGLSLQSFDSYTTLHKLNVMGNVCRHGDGHAADTLFKAHPELWPAWGHLLGSGNEGDTPPAELMKISRELLTQFVNAIDVFWMDMECHGLESFGSGEPHIESQIAALRYARIPKLQTFRPDLVG